MQTCPLRAARMGSIARLLFVFLIVLPVHQAWAIDAIVLAVNGGVSATRLSPSGQRNERTLRTSDEVNAGDLLNTGIDGRLQLRFTDGAIVSLQPGTQFKIDEYQYQGSNQRGFFSLLRGALRTTSGAIGKRNFGDYEMRTPTATIGIRGTEYIAEFTVCDPICAPGPQAGLRVAVSEGVVAVTNPAGEIRVAQGQAAGAESLTSAPTLIDSRPTLQPRTLNFQTLPSTALTTPTDRGDRETGGTTNENNDVERPNQSVAEMSYPNQTPGTTRSTIQVSDDSPASKLSTRSEGSAPFNDRRDSSGARAFSPSSLAKSSSKTDSGVLIAPSITPAAEWLMSVNRAILNAVLMPSGSISGSTANTVNANNTNNTNNTSNTSNLGNFGIPGPNSASEPARSLQVPHVSSNGQIMPIANNGIGDLAPGKSVNGFDSPTYVLREPALSGKTASGTTTSRAQGKSDPNGPDSIDNGPAGIGSMVTSPIDSHRNSDGSMVIARAVDKGCSETSGCMSTGGNSSPGSGTTGSGMAAPDNSGSSSAGSGVTGSGSSASGTTGSGTTGSGTTGSGTSGSGTAGAGTTGSGTTGSGTTGSGTTGSGGSTTLVPGPISSSALSLNLRGVPLLNTLSLASANSLTTLDPERRLQSVGVCPSLLCLSRGTAFYAENETHSDAYVSWGRWKSGAVDLRILGIPTSVNLSYWQGLHYLVGVPTLLMPTAGSFSYSLTGATLATTSDGSVAPGTLSASAVVQFGSGTSTRVGIQGSVAFANTSLQFASNGGINNVAASNLNMTSTNTFSGTLSTSQTGSGPLNCPVSGCTTQLRGGFYGPDAARLGIDYSISGSSSNRTINGVGVFTKQ